jgi:glycosyltransferase involved in cell wall biosynthesis/lauroyl/myristoyl acyltransferase
MIVAGDVTPDANPADLDKAPPATGWLKRSRDSLKLAALSAALWLAYVPYYVVLRASGPRVGILWVRLAANVHWLLTFVGAQPATRAALRSMRPYFSMTLSVSEILRRHLLLKHECFARARVWNGATRRGNDLQWKVNPGCERALPTMPRERGLIIVGYHFNFFLLSPGALKQILSGVDVVQLRYRSWRSVENAATPIARLAMKKAMEADRRAGSTVFYIDENTIVELFRLLRKGGVVAVTADGGAAAEFVEVPFFDGLLRVPSAWAKIAAGAKADVLLVCDTALDHRTREGWFFDHVRCSGTSQDAAYEAAAESIRILEQMIRREPWGWHPWQRLRVEVGADGVRRYSLKQYGFESGDRLGGKTPASPAPWQNAKKPALPQEVRPECQRRPRVAVITNSRPPYRLHLQQRIVKEIPEIEFWSVATHDNAYKRWKGVETPAAIRPADFGLGQPTNEQTQLRYSMREWLKGGRIIDWLREHQIDMVLVQGCGDMGRMRIIHWCRRQGIPCFITGDFNTHTDNHGPLKHWIKRQVYERAIRWCTGLMPCGALGLQLLKRYGGGDKPAAMYPFTPDVELFENAPSQAIEQVRERIRLSPERRRIVFSARMMHVKRPDLAMKAFAAIAQARPDWDLVMLGDGPLRRQAESSVPVALRDRVIWTGFLNDSSEIAGLYAQCDVLLLPSDYEPWGVVVVEAAAAGLAIVASDVVGASPELIKPGRNGDIFPAGDVNKLADALLSITAEERIDQARRESPAVLREWLEENDPVEGLRWALRLTHLMPETDNPAPQGARAGAHWIGAAGAAVAPV